MGKGALLLPTLLLGCGLSQGGLDAPADGGDVDGFIAADSSVSDAIPDLAVEDRGSGMNDSGMTCKCVSPDFQGKGWSPAAIQIGPAGQCPTGYTSAMGGAFLQSPKASGYGCTCSCGVGTPGCSVPNTVAFSYGNLCLATFKTSPNNVVIGQCKDFDQNNINGGNDPNVRVTGWNATGTCPAATVTPTKGSVATADVQLCVFDGALGSCGQSPCVPPPAMPYRMCVAKLDPGGVVGCPADFPASTDGMGAGPTRIGTAVDDSSITCPGCNCNGAPGQCNASVAVMDDTCQNGGNKLYTNTGNCSAHNQGGTFRPKSFTVSAAPSIACLPSWPNGMANPIGQPTLSGTKWLVCCQP